MPGTSPGMTSSYQAACRRHCEERSDEAIHSCFAALWIASGAHSRDPLARNDVNHPFLTRALVVAPNIGIWFTASTTAKVMISIAMPSTEIAARSPLSLRS
jgi:hypothetical protein